MTSDYWFKPKTHGYGAYPTNWKGWALIVGFVAADLVLVLALIAFILPSKAQGSMDAGLFVVWLCAMAALVAGFLWLTKIKTDGDWRWRWGSGAGK